MTSCVVGAAIIAAVIACSRWLTREPGQMDAPARPAAWAHRPRTHSLGGPDDGRGCLTDAQRVTFNELVEPLRKASS